ncbi:Yip1 family protein [Sporosarcina obsidiansis]|uniref:Yip1 family protein n=1 Tax=Sporosarcina obsidiansis TaxID=2660748 RepID=UPI00129A8631|nr:Yip1 family protein [Sporosarcina obsidiansis]
MKPFLTIWSQPSNTIRYVMEHKNISYGVVIIALATLTVAPMTGTSFYFIDEFSIPVVLGSSLVLMFFGSLLAWLLQSVLSTWIGKWLGGKGSFKEMMSVIPLSIIPTIWMFPLTFLFMISMIFTMMNEGTPMATAFVLLVFAGPLINLIFFGLSIYSTVILSKAIGIVHQFSSWRGFGTLAIIFGIFCVIGFVVIFVFSALFYAILSY